MLRVQNIAAVWLTAAAVASAQEATKPAYLGVVTVPTPDGELIVQIEADSPAAAAGLRVGETILKLDNQPLTSQQPLRMQMRGKKADQTASLSIRDSAGNVTTKSVTLRARREAGSAAPQRRGHLRRRRGRPAG